MKDWFLSIPENITDLASYATVAQFFLWLLIGIGSFAFSIVTTWFLWKKRSRRQNYKEVYFPKNIVDFYHRFSDDVRKSKKTIRNVGDGFLLSNPASLKGANTLDSAFCYAMDRGVQVSRFQLSQTAPISWYMRLAYLKRRYPENFRIFMNESYDSMGSFCVIDQGLRGTVFEHQTASGTVMARGTEPVDYEFVYGHQSKSDQAANLFDRAVNDPSTIELQVNDLEKLLESEWDRKLKRALMDPAYVVIDPEMIEYFRAQESSGRFPAEKFEQLRNIAESFEPNWHT